MDYVQICTVMDTPAIDGHTSHHVDDAVDHEGAQSMRQPHW